MPGIYDIAASGMATPIKTVLDITAGGTATQIKKIYDVSAMGLATLVYQYSVNVTDLIHFANPNFSQGAPYFIGGESCVKNTWAGWQLFDARPSIGYTNSRLEWYINCTAGHYYYISCNFGVHGDSKSKIELYVGSNFFESYGTGGRDLSTYVNNLSGNVTVRATAYDSGSYALLRCLDIIDLFPLTSIGMSVSDAVTAVINAGIRASSGENIILL